MRRKEPGAAGLAHLLAVSARRFRPERDDRLRAAPCRGLLQGHAFLGHARHGLLDPRFLGLQRIGLRRAGLPVYVRRFCLLGGDPVRAVPCPPGRGRVFRDPALRDPALRDLALRDLTLRDLAAGGRACPG